MPAARVSRRILRAVLGGSFCLFVFAAFFAVRGWREASDLSRGPRPWDILPADTIFFMHVADGVRYQKNFGRYHNAALASPTLTAVRHKRDSLAYLNPPLSLPSPRGVSLVGSELGKAAPFDYFSAMVPPAAGDNQLFEWIQGGRTPGGPLALRWLLGRLPLKAGSRWDPQQEDGFELRSAETEAAGTIHAACFSGWILVASDRDRLLGVLRQLRAPSASLSQDEVFQKSLSASHREALLWIYAKAERVVETLRRAGSNASADALDPQRSGLRAASWGWHSNGPNGPAFDLLAFEIEESTLTRLSRAFPPLPVGAFAGKQDGRLSVLCLGWNAEALRESPGLGSLRGLQEIETKFGATSSLVRRTVARSPGTAAAVTWESVQPDASVAEEDWIARAGALPGCPAPFLEMRIDYRSLMAFWQSDVTSHYADWKQVAAARGVTMPEVAPPLVLDEWFSKIRVTVGIEAQQLMIYNALDLKKTGSTSLTPLTALATAFWSEELVARRSELAAQTAGSTALDSATLIEAALPSGLLLGPMFSGDHGGNVGLDLIAVDFLSTASRPAK